MRIAGFTRVRSSPEACRGSISAARRKQVRRRVDYVNELHRSGHEIASHAVGHFNGGGWSAADWEKEFRAFDDILDKVGPNNGLDERQACVRRSTRSSASARPIWPRAPGLYAALKATASATTPAASAMPMPGREKIDGIWRFNLAMLRIARLGQGHAVDGLQFLRGASRRRRPIRAARAWPASRCSRPISPISRPTTPATARRCTSGIISATIRAAPTTRR